MADTPWYKDGLKFTCTQCGNCCTGFEGFVWLTEAELKKIAEFLNQPLEEVRGLHTYREGRRQSLKEKGENHDCTFFDPVKRGCTIYPVRPMQCRTWPFWNSNLAAPEDWEEIKSLCPGAGVGQLYDITHIEREAARVNV